MNIQQIMASSHQILDHLNYETDEFFTRATPDSQRMFHGMTGFLGQQAKLIENEPDLLRIADLLHELAADVPGMLANGYQPEQFQVDADSQPSLNGRPKCSFVEKEKEYLERSLDQVHSKLNERVVYPPPKVVAFTENPDPWKWFGAFKDDPTWDEWLEEIERERDMHWI